MYVCVFFFLLTHTHTYIQTHTYSIQTINAEKNKIYKYTSKDVRRKKEKIYITINKHKNTE